MPAPPTCASYLVRLWREGDPERGTPAADNGDCLRGCRMTYRDAYHAEGIVMAAFVHCGAGRPDLLPFVGVKALFPKSGGCADNPYQGLSERRM